jgi:AcrR family transcriptional regulator
VPRAPRQYRGQKRVEEILDAAEQVIAEVGIEAATTNAIAARAGAGMGSLYHFFPDKAAIVEALASRYANTLRGLTQYATQPELARVPLARMVDAIIDPLVAFMTASPAYRYVFHATNRPGAPAQREQCLHDEVRGQVEHKMAARAPHTDPEQRRIHAMVAVEFVHRMLDFAWEVPAAQRPAVIAEIKRLLTLHAEMIEKGDDPLARLG